MSNLSRYALPALIVSCISLPSPSLAVHWEIEYVNSQVINTNESDLSGIAYLNSSVSGGGKHSFFAVSDQGKGLFFDASFSPSTGELTDSTVLSSMNFTPEGGFEGVVKRGSSYFLSDDSPGIRQYDATGMEIESLGVPADFSENTRNDSGLKSLAINKEGNRLWTGNEEALLFDGPLTTSSTGSTVRILEYNTSGNSFSLNSQYAYTMDPIHGSGSGSKAGLTELLSMPDGSLLALERSFVGFFDFTYESRIFEIDSTGATEVSGFTEGLEGEVYTPVGKEALFAGQIGKDGGADLQGLAVGPELLDGSFVLLGVTDNQGLSDNLLVTFKATPLVDIPDEPATADFNRDGTVDGLDFLAWQRGTALDSDQVLVGLGDGDGNHDRVIDDDDLALWKAAYGSAPLEAVQQAVPEPASVTLLGLIALGVLAGNRRRGG